MSKKRYDPDYGHDRAPDDNPPPPCEYGGHEVRIADYDGFAYLMQCVNCGAEWFEYDNQSPDKD
jgi:hypothetical protein